MAGVDTRLRIEKLVTAVASEKFGWLETIFVMEYAPKVMRGAKA
jgi:hypothetical protein